MDDDVKNENEDEMDTNEEQVERVFDALSEAVDALLDEKDICPFNILVAINQLAVEYTMLLHEDLHGYTEDDDISDVGNIPGTTFSKN
jgi:hypothetical protein